MINNIVKKQSELEHLPAGGYRLEYTSDIDGLQDWAMVVPAESRTWIVNLHGHGSHGDQLFIREDIRKVWLPEFIKTGAGILCPNLRDNAWMSPAAASDLHGQINHLRSEYSAERFIFFGGSMGGTGNLLYATLYPEDVDVCLALGAATDLSSFYDWCMAQPADSTPYELGSAIKKSYSCEPRENSELFSHHSTLKNCDKLTMSVFFAHGQADELIPVDQAHMLVDKMTGRESFKYHEIPDGDHDSPLLIPEAIDFFKKMV